MWKKLAVVTVAVLLVLAILAACGATPEPQVIVEEVERAPMPTAAPAAEREVAVEPTAAPPASGALGLAAPAIPRVERMIIKNAELDLLVADTDTAIDGVTVIAADYGGYIISSHSWFEGEFKYATIRLGVPVAEFENVLRRLRGLALKVNSEIASGEDVTDQYVDLQSQLTNLEATRDRIREFLDKAMTVEEALEVNQQLSEVEAQIEEIQGRMNYLADRSAYSTIDVQLNPERPTPTPTPTLTPTPTPTPVAWRPGQTAKDASNVLTAILKGLGNLTIWVVIVLGPFLVPLALLIWLIVWLRRRRKRQSPPPPAPPAADES